LCGVVHISKAMAVREDTHNSTERQGQNIVGWVFAILRSHVYFN
jgi:hypothetical protein